MKELPEDENRIIIKHSYDKTGEDGIRGKKGGGCGILQGEKLLRPK